MIYVIQCIVGPGELAAIERCIWPDQFLRLDGAQPGGRNKTGSTVAVACYGVL